MRQGPPKLQHLYTPEELDRHITYDPNTGLFRRPNGRLSGLPGNGNVYINIHVRVRHYPAHILAWALYHRRWPKPGYHIHHLNGIRYDNRIANLVEVTPLEHSRLEWGYKYRSQ